MNYIIVGIGGALGAISRYVLYQLPLNIEFSIITLMINIFGSIFLGYIFYQFQHHNKKIYLFVTTGFLSGFTTFSTFSLETITLLQESNYGQGTMNIVLSLFCCIGGCGLGAWIGKGRTV